jgi:hypothetical protein
MRKVGQVDFLSHLSASLPCSEEKNNISKIVRAKRCKRVFSFFNTGKFGTEPPANSVHSIRKTLVADASNPSKGFMLSRNREKGLEYSDLALSSMI